MGRQLCVSPKDPFLRWKGWDLLLQFEMPSVLFPHENVFSNFHIHTLIYKLFVALEWQASPSTWPAYLYR